MRSNAFENAIVIIIVVAYNYLIIIVVAYNYLITSLDCNSHKEIFKEIAMFLFSRNTDSYHNYRNAKAKK